MVNMRALEVRFSEQERRARIFDIFLDKSTRSVIFGGFGRSSPSPGVDGRGKARSGAFGDRGRIRSLFSFPPSSNSDR